MGLGHCLDLLLSYEMRQTRFLDYWYQLVYRISSSQLNSGQVRIANLRDKRSVCSTECIIIDWSPLVIFVSHSYA